NLLQRAPTKDRAASYEKRGVQAVFAGLQNAEKELLVLPDSPSTFVDVVRERVGVIEILWRLHERDALILEEAEEPVDHVRQRHMLRVELEDEFAGAVPE